MSTLKIKNRIPTAQYLLTRVLSEIQRLRQEVSLFVPQEDLKDYAHHERIKKSYQRALKQYPPGLWR